MKKSISLMLIILYFFTGQLTVHVFAMHWWLHWTHHKHHCWHTDSNKDNTHDMSLCLEQSMWAFVESIPYITDTNTDYKQRLIYTFFASSTIEQQYIYSLHDPWWWNDGNFSIYLDQLYGHGIIMHC